MKLLLGVTLLFLTLTSFASQAASGDDVFNNRFMGKTKYLNDNCMVYGYSQKSSDNGKLKYTIIVSNNDSNTEMAFASFEENSELIQKIETAKKFGGSVKIINKMDFGTIGINEKLSVQLNFNEEGKLISAIGRDLQNFTYLKCEIE